MKTWCTLMANGSLHCSTQEKERPTVPKIGKAPKSFSQNWESAAVKS